MRAREAIKRHFNKVCLPYPVFHDFKPDEKYLQETFHDTRILLRWNRARKVAQIWYDAPSGLYCVLSVEEPYSREKAGWLLRQHEKSKRQAAEMYCRQMESYEKKTDEQIAETVGHTADAVRSWSVGKVTTSGKGLTI